MNSAVERAARYIWDHYSEPLCLADIARSALLSPYYLSRIFRDTTGVPPGRFLSAVRIFQAKHILLTTSMGVADVAFAVGYNSPGSFTTHFTGSVGIAPGLFRRAAQDEGFGLMRPPRDPSPEQGAVHGKISLPGGYTSARVYLGAFTTPIVQHWPASAIVVDIPADGQPASYRLPDVPRGRWYIHAVGVADSADPEPWTCRVSLVGTHTPVSAAERRVARAAISLRPRKLTDPPILLALPDLEIQPTGSTLAERELIWDTPLTLDILAYLLEARCGRFLSRTAVKSRSGLSGLAGTRALTAWPCTRTRTWRRCTRASPTRRMPSAAAARKIAT